MRKKTEKQEIHEEMDVVIREFKQAGISHDTTDEEIARRGLGDVVESILTRCGITQEQYKRWTGLKECGCTARKMWLNRLLSWSTK